MFRSFVWKHVRGNAAVRAAVWTAGQEALVVGSFLSRAALISPSASFSAVAWRVKSTQASSDGSSRADRRKRLRELKKKTKILPELKDTLRKLYMKTHPDLFTLYPKERHCNEESYKDFMNFIDTIQNHHKQSLDSSLPSHPAAQDLSLPFYLKTATEGEFQRVVLDLRSTGGDCKNLMEESIGLFFERCGLPPLFKWGEQSWGIHSSENQAWQAQEDQRIQQERKQRHEENQVVHEDFEATPSMQQPDMEQAPAFWDVQSLHAGRNGGELPQKATIESILEDINDELEVIAACPWLTDNEEHKEVAEHFQEKDGLDLLELKAGVKVKDAIQSIWDGERDASKLFVGLDDHSCQVVNRVLMHTMGFEKQLREQIDKSSDEAVRTMDDVITELDDVLQLIASCPWLPDEGKYGEVRSYYQDGNGLNEIESRGFSIKKSVEQIWSGERNESKLCDGLSEDSQKMVRKILEHAILLQGKLEDAYKRYQEEVEVVEPGRVG